MDVKVEISQKAVLLQTSVPFPADIVRAGMNSIHHRQNLFLHPQIAGSQYLLDRFLTMRSSSVPEHLELFGNNEIFDLPAERPPNGKKQSVN